MFQHIGYKIIAVIGSVVALALVAVTLFYTQHQERSILAQNQRTMSKLTESVIEGLQTVMIAGYADVAQTFAERLQNVPEIVDFRILRTTGYEAFLDNQTIDAVNQRRGEEEFFPREREIEREVLEAGHPQLVKAVAEARTISYYETPPFGDRFLTFLAPIKNHTECHKCHGGSHEVRGVLKLTTSLAPVEADIAATRSQALLVGSVVLLCIVALTGVMIRRSVVHPINSMTEAMARVAQGDLSQSVPIMGRDELSRMALSFNSMARQLLETYQGLHTEQDKLTTIILSAREGIVVTDGSGQIVLHNPAALELLGKSGEELVAQGFERILDDPDLIARQLAQQEHPVADVVEYKGRILSVNASQIQAEEGAVIGSAALLRDITDEKRLEAQLRKLSTTDALTDLYNRRHLDASLKQELNRARRYEADLSILMFDVDHFKRFNDEHGHDQGDRVLQSLGQVMRDHCRTVDIPCRYGGEEFLIILPSTDLDGAQVLAERLRASVEQTPVDGLHVTISIGVAHYPSVEAGDAEAFVERADHALYAAKQAGRNCVRVAR